MRILLYGNGASENHGCEAIVRGTVSLIGRERNTFLIYSDSCEEDRKYGLEALAEIREAKIKSRRNLQFTAAYLRMKLMHDYTAMDILPYKKQIQNAVNHVDLALSAGGDNYCYDGNSFYTELNKAYHRSGIKTVLWGCSIEPDIVKKRSIQKDLMLYDAIIARESISYNAIRQTGANTIISPDPAFFMKAEKCELDKRFEDHDIIGVNISPMIVSNEKATGSVLANYRQLVQYIMNNTDCDVALIPHVVWPQNDDRSVIKQLYDLFDNKERLIVVDDMTAPELKYCISRCRFFIGARTHATIAAYSSGVPTLAVGYSVKATGLAKDLFGDTEHYVIPVQSLCGQSELTEAFQWIADREDMIRNHLAATLPGYMKQGEAAKNLIYKICEE